MNVRRKQSDGPKVMRTSPNQRERQGRASASRRFGAAKARAAKKLANPISGIRRQEEIRERLFRASWKGGMEPWIARELAFHMVDWFPELDELHRLFTGNCRWSTKTANTFVCRFLIHAPHHVVAAAKLFHQPIRDIFEYGVLPGGRMSADMKKVRAAFNRKHGWRRPVIDLDDPRWDD
ncbi:MAG: hypothetical protein K2Y21_12130 [Phycisphaerales bacterium]|nr:hypothetical protein [Phycisphaerales bacterium]